MAEDNYASLTGTVQKFGDKDVVTEREVGEQTVRSFVVKSATSGKLVTVNVWPEFDLPEITKGTFAAVDGKFTINEKNGTTYYNITANTLVLVPGLVKSETERPAKKESSGAPF